MRRIIIAGLSAIVLSTGFTATASAATHAPNERCKPLDVAERQLHHKGFRTVEHGGGMFGILVKSAWVVVYQHQSGKTVHLTAGRSCS
jgi:ABC-type transport system involved in cytochrome c biogenesis permease subunit